MMAVCPDWNRPVYEPSRRKLTWPNGAVAITYSADEPDRLRGPQHDAAAVDEICLVAGTRIQTGKGPAPIESVAVGDEVHTRKGLRRVTRQWMTSNSADVYRLRTTDGKTLTGTARHPVFVVGKGFIGLSSLVSGDTLIPWISNWFAAISSKRLEPRQSVAREHVATCCVVSVEKLAKQEAVYNIEVQGEHEYFANGILTHNCAWRYPDTFDMLMFGLRLGDDPRCAIATTPKPVKLLKELLARESKDGTYGKAKDVVVTRGSTYQNSANLAPAFFDSIIAKYEGTRLGRQELLAELLTDVPNALWQRSKIDELRVTKVPELRRIVIAIDPAAKSEEGSDETGIIVAGVGKDGHGYVLEDLSGQYQPLAWARKAIGAYRNHKADRIIAEINNGGEMVEATLRSVDITVSYKAVHATRGKVIRAEPIAALYEQGKVHHVGSFAKLEDQLCEMTLDFDRSAAGYSPDRLDAAVWALTELIPGTRSFFG